MNGATPSATDPRILLEAARVFNAAGSDYRKVAEVVAELALENIAKADPDVRPQIIGDAARCGFPAGCWGDISKRWNG